MREIFIPPIGVSTWISDQADEKEIIEAVAEATVGFCLACEKHGMESKKKLKK